jgi:dTDP-4-dehydrorhamnose reductase
MSMVWITGAGGLLGNLLLKSAARFAPGRSVIGVTREWLDLADFAAVRRVFREQRPEAVIHCAAMSKTPACQASPELAHRINVELTALLAELASGQPFLFFSTDLVFDGRKGNYVESDAPHPLNTYAETKVAAEQAVLRNPRHTIIRTSINYGVSPTGDRSFNEEMAAAWRAGRALNLFTDEFRCPIPAEVTARAAWELLHRGATGLFHVAGAERLSRCEIGQLVAARHPELHPRLQAGSIQDYTGPARSPDTSLNCAKAQALLTFPLPRFSDWMASHG